MLHKQFSDTAEQPSGPPLRDEILHTRFPRPVCSCRCRAVRGLEAPGFFRESSPQGKTPILTDTGDRAVGQAQDPNAVQAQSHPAWRYHWAVSRRRSANVAAGDQPNCVRALADEHVHDPARASAILSLFTQPGRCRMRAQRVAAKPDQSHERSRACAPPWPASFPMPVAMACPSSAYVGSCPGRHEVDTLARRSVGVQTLAFLGGQEQECDQVGHVDQRERVVPPGRARHGAPSGRSAGTFQARPGRRGRRRSADARW